MKYSTSLFIIMLTQLALGQVNDIQFTRFRDTLNKVDDLLKQDNQPPLAFSTYVTVQQFKSYRGQITTTFRDTNHDELEITLQGEVVSMYRNTVVYPEPYLSPPKPKWTLDQVKQKAKDWIIGLFGLSGDIGNPQIRFDIKQDPPEHYNGKWVVRWPRLSKDGYPFFHDAVSANFDEHKGCISASYNYTSIFKEDSSPIISSADAKKESLISAQHLIDTYSNKSIPAGITLGSISLSPMLMVMNHNNAFYSDQIDAINYEQEASLAWRVAYFLNSGNKQIGVIIVCIDAHSSQPVAGDFVLR